MFSNSRDYYMNKWKLTLNDVAKALGEEEVFQSGHLLFKLTHQSVVGILVDDSVATDLFGSVCIPETNT